MKTTKTFSLDVEFARKLAMFSAERGETMSDVIAKGAMLYMGLPLPAADPEKELEAKGLTRSERTVFADLEAQGHTWSTVQDVIRRTGLSVGIANKSLRSLERAGMVHFWGEDHPDHPWQYWSRHTALECVAKVCARVPEEGPQAVYSEAKRLAHGIIEGFEPCRELYGQAFTGLPPSVWQNNTHRYLEKIARAEESQKRAEARVAAQIAEYEAALAEAAQLDAK